VQRSLTGLLDSQVKRVELKLEQFDELEHLLQHEAMQVRQCAGAKGRVGWCCRPP
jgi:hypothetical protein